MMKVMYLLYTHLLLPHCPFRLLIMNLEIKTSRSNHNLDTPLIYFATFSFFATMLLQVVDYESRE